MVELEPGETTEEVYALGIGDHLQYVCQLCRKIFISAEAITIHRRMQHVLEPTPTQQ